MESVIRAAAVYLFVMLLMRISGKRTFAEMTAFDFVFLLIIGDATQQALLNEDFSMINAFLVVTTLVAIDVGLSLWKQRSKTFERVLDDEPMLLIAEGRVYEDRMKDVRVDIEDVLATARMQQGLERLDQIKYAVLERNGGISIIPKKSARA
jgi:uncharacterized membrane protein YcaP (DUF421 family)